MRLRDTRAYRAARYKLARLVAGIIALAVAIHALVKVVVQSNHSASDWAYVGVSCAVAVAVWLVVARSAQRPEPRRARRR
jgi:bacteriorhodopsin